MKRIIGLALAAAIFLFGAQAYGAETIKIAYIDPFSGPLGFFGASTLRQFRLVEDLARQAKGGGDLAIEFTEFDNKASPQETLLHLKSAVDQGFRYVMQGIGSGASASLIDAVNKYNERNPGKEVVYINWTANDPDLTNSKCSFWHFRMDAHADMKAEAYTTFLAGRPAMKKLYLINPNYAPGQAVSVRAKEYLARKRPELQIVGDDLIPMAQVKDFAPYISKIKASGADSVLTSNIGPDLSLLIKAAKDASLNVDFYTFYANAPGVAAAFGAAPADHLYLLSAWNSNAEPVTGPIIADAMKKRHNEDFVTFSADATIGMLRAAHARAKTTDPVKMAFAMEGLKYNTIAGPVEMRKTDHQLLPPLYMSVWSKADGKTVKYDSEKSGYGWKPVQKLEPYVSAQPTSCQMKRPAGG